MRGSNELDLNEFDSNADEDEPYELCDIVEERGLEQDVSASDVDGNVVSFIFHRNRFSRRSAHPLMAASLSVRKKVSIASTWRRILSNEGRYSGIGVKI